jgi:hypothetical protein
LTGRSSKQRPRVLDCPVKPGNDTNRVSAIGKCSSGCAVAVDAIAVEPDDDSEVEAEVE